MIIEALVHYFRQYGFQADALPGRIMIRLEHDGMVWGWTWAIERFMLENEDAHSALFLRAGWIMAELRLQSLREKGTSVSSFASQGEAW